jgi:4-hydroxy-tetrahydrodipicolinate reductase
MSAPVRVLLVGANGRMGQAIVSVAQQNVDAVIAAKIDQGDAIPPIIGDCDVLIDFSHADATTMICDAAVHHRKALVIGTTGQSDEQKAAIEKAARSIPVVFAPNFSIGVNALFWLARKAASMLGVGFDLEIIEMHHRLKKDAPSGTAKKLAEILADVRQLDFARNAVHGRQGDVGERQSSEIGIHAIRGGDVVGDHTVVFAGAGERLELTHRAASRETFAMGALRAAKWVVGCEARLYTMEDVLGL